jgi:hypothetical protein
MTVVFYVIKKADPNYKPLVISNLNKNVGKVRYICHPIILVSTSAQLGMIQGRINGKL